MRPTARNGATSLMDSASSTLHLTMGKLLFHLSDLQARINGNKRLHFFHIDAHYFKTLR